MAKQVDKQAYNEWKEYRQALLNSTSIDVNETLAEKKARIKRLEADFEEWIKYYFPKYATAEPADFHKKASKRIFKNPEWYEVRAWARELAKDVRTMFEVLNLTLTGQKKCILLVSNSEDNAIRLLEPYRANLDSNQRIINDYGKQESVTNWKENEFKTTKGVSFRALGAGQSPRGTRNENIRPDTIIVTDIDTDKDCQNPLIIEKRFKWIESALIPTRSVSVPLLILFLNNIIAEYCCVTEAIKKADYTDIVNIRTNGKSSWPQKNTEAHIDRVLSKISYAAAQGEYFNTPTTEGRTFKKLTWGKVPPLNEMDALLEYGDPSPSNNETKQNSYKSVVLLGKKGIRIYVIKVFCEQTTNATFANWYYDLRDYCNSISTDLYLLYWIENNSLQDPFYKQVFLPLFKQIGKLRGLIPIRPDERKKPDKYTRIEGTLEPLNRMGELVLNEAEKDNPHMQTLEGQMRAVSPTFRGQIDGADALEGGTHKLLELTMRQATTHRTVKRSNRKF